uniref:ATP synthase subunit a n=1 Tax=Ruidocollaris convexipennis TaxID=2708008 RepID=A0A6G6A655_9ORTH|nr:ATP synthase F0 subunit 6 [Ruidocollaris convexipennis]QID03776.1 ATP synthase F0 subunit 6 [Ruidocollaris convexipennis]
MMMNLFSVFDPSTSIFNLSINWMSTLSGFFIVPMMFWLLPSRYIMIWSSMLSTLHQELKLLLYSYQNLGATLIFLSLFTFILCNNFLGLFPYIFTSSSHLSMTLTLALPLWLSFLIYGWLNHTQHMFAHLMPQGTPPALMPFMVCIETISNLIRPGTLAIRLAANMIAGHLLLTLLGNTGPFISMPITSILIISQMALLMLESAVAIIQAYVFTILTTLYASEI